MTPDRWRRIDELFEAALDRDPAEREAFLDEACGDDSALRREVERLLEVDERAGDFIERPALTSAVWPRGDAESDALERTTPSHPPIDEGRFVPGTVVSGRYRIVSLLGRGGMGEVYRADDLTLRQPVALKFLPAGLSRDPLALERLFQEVRVARQIAHRNVCRVYDVGEGRRAIISSRWSSSAARSSRCCSSASAAFRTTRRSRSRCSCAPASRPFTRGACCIATSSPPTS